MYLSFYELREPPFSLSPDPSFLYLSERHRMAWTMLEYGLASRTGFILITGEIGTGKTTLIRYLMNHLGEDSTVGLISNTHRAFGELIQWISLAFNLPSDGVDKVTMFRRFQEFIIEEYAKGRRTVLIVDEAQNMAADTLEELRVISNINSEKDLLLQVVLVGQPELRRTLRRPELEQFAQRISVDYHLGPFDAPEETQRYISHRLVAAGGRPDTFDSEAKLFIHHQAGGVPRLINALCDMSLVYGFAEQKKIIKSDLVFEVVNDRVSRGLFGTGKRRGLKGPEQIDSEDVSQLKRSMDAVRKKAAKQRREPQQDPEA